MNLNIVTEYPFWFILLCLLLAGLYAFALYFRDKKHEFPLWLSRLLAAFRFITVSILAFLLLSPLLKTITRTIDYPIIILGQDNSYSVMLGDSVYYNNQYINDLNGLISGLSEDFEVKTFAVGEKTRANPNIIFDTNTINYQDKLTDLSGFFEEISVLFVNRNIGAVILASDGIYNKGTNPVYSISDYTFPVYTIALGDTNVKRDVILKRVNYNRIAYLGNQFPLEVVVHADKCKFLNSRLSVIHKGKTVASKNISFPDDKHARSILLKVKADEPGLHRYIINLSKVPGEDNTFNNTMEVFIDVLDARQKILLLANSPHPDISAIKQAIQDNYNYEVEDYLVHEFDGNIAQYNLVILHQLPSLNSASFRIINEINRIRPPLLFIIGQQTDLNIFNGLKTGLLIETRFKNKLNEAQPAFNEDFILFTLPESTVEMLSYFPPLFTYFGTYGMTQTADVLFYQKIHNMVSDAPLIVFNKAIENKICVITGEGLWRWRITNFVKEGNHKSFVEIINKIIQFLSVKEDKRPFRVSCDNNYFENENVIFDAELYNESYEPVNDPDIELVIESEEGKTYKYMFNKTGNGYMLDAGGFTRGNYFYKAQVKHGNKLLTDEGSFSIIPLEIEKTTTIANHDLLYHMAEKNDGQVVYPENIKELHRLISEREDVKQVVYIKKRFTELVNIPWIFITLISLLAVEWFFRKWGGSY